MTVQLETISSPKCRNINPWSAERCLNPECALPLGPIRAFLSEQTAGEGSANVDPSLASTKPAEAKNPVEPAPPLPELPQRGEHPPSAKRVGMDQFLVVGIVDRADEIRARFFKRLANGGIDSLKLSTGHLVIDLDEGKSVAHLYDFAERDLREEALATMAVRMAAIGKDLYVNWRHYALPPMIEGTSEGYYALGWIVGVGGLVVAFFGGVAANNGEVFLIILIVCVALGIAIAQVRVPKRAWNLQGFQAQESDAFQLVLRGAILGAIDGAGIDRALVQR